MAQAQRLLAAEEQERRRRVVLLVDEAHLLTPEQLEELRLLTNAEMDSRSPFALLLVGQPTLARQLRMGIFAALDQRIAIRYQLAPMDLGESAQYLRHHLALVGRTDPLFADDAVARLHKASLGPAPRAQQRRHRRAHRRRQRRQGPGRRRLRQEGRRRADPRVSHRGRVPIEKRRVARQPSPPPVDQRGERVTRRAARSAATGRTARSAVDARGAAAPSSPPVPLTVVGIVAERSTRRGWT